MLRQIPVRSPLRRRRQPEPQPLPEYSADLAIYTRNLTRRFGREYAVRDVSLAVPKGSIFGFIGPSGSGKSTTIRLLTGIHPPTSGDVRVLGEPPVLFDTAMRSRIGYMPQKFVLYPELSVRENLSFAASLYAMPWRRGARFKEMLDFVELSEHKRKLARNISGGMQRRLALAATLVHDPELAFLDEPTAGIDPVLRRKFWNRFSDLKEQGRTLFITTQYVSEAAYCDVVGVLARGRLVAIDTPNNLRHRAFGGDLIDLQTSSAIELSDVRAMEQLPFVRSEVALLGGNHLRLTVDEAATDISLIIRWCNENNIQITTIEEHLPPFDDVFVELVRDRDAE